MNLSGPLNPSDVTLHSSYPSQIVVPLDFVDKQSKSAREDLGIDESGLYMVSKALEEFMRRIIRESTNYGQTELNYDSIAQCLASSEFRAIKEFFPQRVRFGDIAEELHNDNGPSTSTPSL